MAASGALLALATLTLLFVVLPYFGYAVAVAHRLLAITLVIAVSVRLVADIFHEAIYSASRDRSWITINIVWFAWSIPVGIGCLEVFGLGGAGVSALLSACVLLILRYKVWRKLDQHDIDMLGERAA